MGLEYNKIKYILQNIILAMGDEVMDRISNYTQQIIKELGYENSGNLYYFANIDFCKDLSFHDRKVLNEIAPCAFFLVDRKPRVLFFDYLSEYNEKHNLYKKIWNSQIPIIISVERDRVKVFNGTSIKFSNIDNFCLDEICKFDILDCNEFSQFSFWNITSENFLRNYQMEFSKDTLNEIMLKNIQCVTNKLKNRYHIKFATKLILRIIFIRFLVDRGIDIGFDGLKSNVEESQKSLLEIVRRKERLYNLFSFLKGKFNGNLFELGDESSDESLKNEIFELLYVFLSGKEEMETGQLSFLPLYDFNIIPIELISNIYEILLGEKVQDKDKAFYTPEYLTDYIVKESISTFLVTHDYCKVLDPSCGSGIFLVKTLKQIIGKNVDKNGYINDNSLLCSIVEENIYGVDLNPEAIDVTIFSLYLTLFDYKDPKKLDNFKLPNLKEKNIIVSDFFDDCKLEKIKGIKFQFIIGNPPWGSIKEGLHLEYCKKNGIPQQRYEISRSFIAKVKDYSSEETTCCLIIPSKLFYNKQKPAIEFRKLLLLKCEIQQVLELSSVRDLVFKKADAPAAILIFKHKDSNCLSHKMIYISLKPNMFFKLYHVIAIEKNDIKTIQQAILYNNDWAWKTCVYGNSWDIDIIKTLKKKFISINDAIIKYKLVKGAGISDNDGNYDASRYIGKKIINSYAIDAFYYDGDQSTIFNKQKIYRLGKSDIFEPPFCLLRKGANCSNYRLRAAYSEDNIIFKEAISAIKGDINQKNLLLNIMGILNSSLYVYLNLMLGSSMGIEREQVFMNEIYSYPFIKDEDIGNYAREIQNKNSNFINGFRKDISVDIEKLDELVLEKFGLDHDPFIDYAINVQIPMLYSSKMNYREVNGEEMYQYSKVFREYWKELVSKQNKFVKVALYPKVMGKFAVFALAICDERQKLEYEVFEDIDKDKSLLSRFLIQKINEQFYQIRDVIYFEKSSFFIVKSNEYKNWHSAMAYIDHAAVIETILSDRKGE